MHVAKSEQDRRRFRSGDTFTCDETIDCDVDIVRPLYPFVTASRKLGLSGSNDSRSS
jgi:hypothetical protein